MTVEHAVCHPWIVLSMYPSPFPSPYLSLTTPSQTYILDKLGKLSRVAISLYRHVGIILKDGDKIANPV